MNPDLIDWSLNDLSQDDPLLIKLLQEKYLIEPNKRAFNLTLPMTASLANPTNWINNSSGTYLTSFQF